MRRVQQIIAAVGCAAADVVECAAASGVMVTPEWTGTKIAFNTLGGPTEEAAKVAFKVSDVGSWPDTAADIDSQVEATCVDSAMAEIS